MVFGGLLLEKSVASNTIKKFFREKNMATIGFPGDVNNSIPMTNSYPVGRAFGSLPAAATDFSIRNNYAGEIGGLNQDYRGAMMMQATNASMATTQNQPMMTGGMDEGKKPAAWFITFAIIFIIVAWAARKFAPDGEQFAIVKPNLINGVFVTLWIVLILVFLKQVAIRIKDVPGISALAKMILSV